MKVKYLAAVFSFFLVSLGCSSMALAQEESPVPNESSEHVEMAPSEDKGYADHELKSKISHDSSAHYKATSPAKKYQEHAKPGGGKDEDDALSFNFLYYIIQEFKISDLIDE
jgi:hypothetical protein